MSPAGVTETIAAMPPAGAAEVSLSAETIAWLALFVASGVIFWWGFIASARWVARWRFGAWAYAGLTALAVGGLVYVHAARIVGGIQVLATWTLLWSAIVGWIRFGWWRGITTALGRGAGRLRLMLGAKA
jgi:hypothetical protein